MKKNNLNMTDIAEMLKEGTQKVYDSDSYQAYLTTAARFHQYSYRNAMLIWMQDPSATLVAGYRKWQQMGRQVRKGEKAIRILAPMRRTKTQEEDETSVPYFRAISVFDISQTEGDDLPHFEIEKLQEPVASYSELMQVLSLVSPVSIVTDHIQGEANGFYSILDKKIVIRKDMSETQTVKTAVHEIAHALLHADGNAASASVREVEAESVAYSVCCYFGIDTSAYSFAYIASYSHDKNLPELNDSLQRISQTSQDLIQRIETVWHPQTKREQFDA